MINENTKSLILWVSSTASRFGVSGWATCEKAGRKAIELINSNNFQLIFCDLKGLIDGVNGVNLCRHIKKMPINHRVILLSETLGPQEIQWAKSCDSDGIIKFSVEQIALELLHIKGAPTLKMLIDLDQSRLIVKPAVIISKSPPISQSQPMALVEKKQRKPTSLAELTDSLSTYIGPISALEVNDAIKYFKHKNTGRAPTIIDIAKIVSMSITNESDKTQFLNSIEG